MTMLEKTLRCIVLSGIFALPLIAFIVMQSFFFPFITGKNFTFRIIVEVIAISWFALALVNTSYRPRKNWLLAAFAVFVLVIALADALGVNPFKSFWSNFERMDGWITLAHLFAYFVVAAAMLSTEKLWRAFWNVTLAVSAIIGTYALLQFFGIISLNPGFSSAARVDATLGNPIYLAAYMLFHVFIAAMFLSQIWHIRGITFRDPKVFLYGGLALFDTLILFMTGTRGTMLGIVGGVLLTALLFMFLAPNARKVRIVAVGIIVLIALSAGVLFLIRDQKWVQDAPILGRLATISLSERTVASRFLNVSMAWEGFKERPILGWGQENYAIVFSKYYDPRMYGQEEWFDRVHNVIFDWLVAGGILGLLAYLSLYILTLSMLWRRSSPQSGSSRASGAAPDHPFTLPERCILTGLLAAYFFHNLFVFDNIMSYFLFVSVLAYIAYRSSAYKGAPYLFSQFKTSSRILPIVSVIAVLSVWGVVWFVNARPIAANRALLQGLGSYSEGLSKNLELIEKAISYQTIGLQEAREQLMQASARMATIEQVPLSIKERFFDASLRELALQAKESPLDPRFPLFTGILFDIYGGYNEAIPYLEKAHELSPKKQTILFEMAANAFARGDAERTLDLYKQAFELAPQTVDFIELRIIYAAFAIRLGNDTVADELLAPLNAIGRGADARIVAVYVARGRYDKIISIWEAHREAYPNDVQEYFTLAAAYYKVGNSEKAIEVLEAATNVDPSVKTQADALIQDIREGTLEQ